MRVHAAFLAILALSATLGQAASQDRPARETEPAAPGAVQTAASQEWEPDVRALGALLTSERWNLRVIGAGPEDQGLSLTH
jgi:hypothetical protein